MVSMTGSQSLRTSMVMVVLRLSRNLLVAQVAWSGSKRVWLHCGPQVDIPVGLLSRVLRAVGMAVMRVDRAGRMRRRLE